MRFLTILFPARAAGIPPVPGRAIRAVAAGLAMAAADVAAPEPRGHTA